MDVSRNPGAFSGSVNTLAWYYNFVVNPFNPEIALNVTCCGTSNIDQITRKFNSIPIIQQQEELILIIDIMDRLINASLIITI